MSIFGQAPTPDVKVEKEVDFQKRTLDSNVYSGVLSVIFAGQADSGARNVTINAELDNGRKYSETVYITNREGKNTYEKDGKTYYLPGFLLVNNLAILTTGKPLHELSDSVVTRAVKLWNKDAKAEVLTDVQAIEPMIGKRVLLAIEESEEDKTKLNESTNKYEPTGETRITNSIVKCFDPETQQTVVEKTDGAEATALEAWLKTNQGKVRDKKSKKTTSTNTAAAVPNKPSGLFGNK